MFVGFLQKFGNLVGGSKQNIITNINHKGLQRTTNEYAGECSIYKDLISKNNNVDILNSAKRILQGRI